MFAEIGQLFPSGRELRNILEEVARMVEQLLIWVASNPAGSETAPSSDDPTTTSVGLTLQDVMRLE